MAEEEKYSLNTQILFDVEKALVDLKRLGGKDGFEGVSTAFNKMTQAANAFDDSIVKKVEGMYAKVQTLAEKTPTTKASADKIVTAVLGNIEKVLTAKFARSSINVRLTGIDERLKQGIDLKLGKLTLDESKLTALRDKVTAHINKQIEKIQVPKMPPITMNQALFKSIHAKYQAKLAETFEQSANSLMWEWEAQNKAARERAAKNNSKRAPKIQEAPPVIITTEDFAKMQQAVKNKIVDNIANAIDIPSLKNVKLSLDSADIAKSFDKIGGDLARYMLPKIKQAVINHLKADEAPIKFTALEGYKLTLSDKDVQAILGNVVSKLGNISSYLSNNTIQEIAKTNAEFADGIVKFNEQIISILKKTQQAVKMLGNLNVGNLPEAVQMFETAVKQLDSMLSTRITSILLDVSKQLVNIPKASIGVAESVAVAVKELTEASAKMKLALAAIKPDAIVTAVLTLQSNVLSELNHMVSVLNTINVKGAVSEQGVAKSKEKLVGDIRELQAKVTAELAKLTSLVNAPKFKDEIHVDSPAFVSAREQLVKDVRKFTALVSRELKDITKQLDVVGFEAALGGENLRNIRAARNEVLASVLKINNVVVRELNRMGKLLDITGFEAALKERGPIKVGSAEMVDNLTNKLTATLDSTIKKVAIDITKFKPSFDARKSLDPVVSAVKSLIITMSKQVEDYANALKMQSIESIKPEKAQIEQRKVSKRKVPKAIRDIFANELENSEMSLFPINDDAINNLWRKVIEGRPLQNTSFPATVEAMRKAVAKNREKLVNEVYSTMPELDVAEVMRPLNSALLSNLYRTAQSLGVLLQTTKGTITPAVDTSFLHREIVKQLADAHNMTVAEWRKANPVLRGTQSMVDAMQAGISSVMGQFHNQASVAASSAIDLYKHVFKEIKIQPDITAVEYMLGKFNGLQGLIVNKVKEMIDDQFKAMHAEIRNLKINPVTIGYQVPASVGESVAKAITKSVGAVSNEVAKKSARKVGTMGSINEPRYFPVVPMSQGMLYFEPGGDTRTFAGSVINTMRYITAGMFMSIPMTMFNESWKSAKEFDYQIEKARQNFLIKLYDAETQQYDFITSALQDIQAKKETANLPQAEKEALAQEQAAKIKTYLNKGMKRDVQDIALLYGINQEDAAKAFHIASRRFDDPFEAMAMAKQVAKVRGIEEVDIEKAAKGFEAIGSQWAINGYAMQKVANMMIMAANMSQVTIEDLLDTQQRAGVIFREAIQNSLATSGATLRRNERGELEAVGVSPAAAPTKEQALATSIALSSWFSQATARSGAEAGTFFRAIITRPFTGEGRKALEEFSQVKGYEDLRPYVVDANTGEMRQKNFTEIFSSIIDASVKMEDKERNELFSKVFPAWHIGSAKATVELAKDIKETYKLLLRSQGKSEEEANKVSTKEALDEYIKKIAEADERTVALLNAGMMSTYKYQVQRVKTMWQISTEDIFASLKDDFTGLTIYLEAFMRTIRDNSAQVAQLIGFISKLAVAYGLRYAVDLAMQRRTQARQASLTKTFDTNARALVEEGRLYNLRKEVAMEELMTRRNAVRDIYAKYSQPSEAFLQDKQVQSLLAAKKAHDIDFAKELEQDTYRLTGKAAHAVTPWTMAQALVDLDRRQKDINERHKLGQISDEERSKELASIATDREDIQNRVQAATKARPGFAPYFDLGYKYATLAAGEEEQRRAARDREAAPHMQRIGELTNYLNKEYAKQAINLNSRIDMLEKSMQDLGVDSSQLTHKLVRLDTNLNVLEQSIDEIGASAKETARDVRLTDKEFEFLNAELRKIESLRGRAFIDQLHSIERLHMARNKGVGVFGNTPIDQIPVYNTRGVGLLDAIMVNSLLKSEMESGKAHLPMHQRLLFRRESTVGADGINVVTLKLRPQLEWLANVLGTTTNKIRLAGNKLADAIGGIGRSLNSMPGAGLIKGGLWTMLAGFGFSFFDYVGQHMLLSENDRKLMKGTELSNLARSTTNIRELYLSASEDPYFPGKAAKMIGVTALGTVQFFNMLFDSFRGLLGDDSVPTFEDYAKANSKFNWASSVLELIPLGKALANLLGIDQTTQRLDSDKLKDRDKFEELMEETLQGKRLQREARVKAQEKEMESPYEKLLKDKSFIPGVDKVPFEDIEKTIQLVNQRMEREQKIAEFQFQWGKMTAALQGKGEDSEEVNRLLIEYLDKNIVLIDQAIAELGKMSSLVDSDSEQGKLLQAQTSQLMIQKAQAMENKFKADYNISVGRPLNDLQKNLEIAGAQYDIKALSAMASGVNEDSPTIRAIEAAKAREQVALIEATQTKLRGELSSGKWKGDVGRDIWLQILKLEVDQKQLLADIKKNTGKSVTTFNLPDGIKPLTYWEAATANATNKMVTARQGDVIVSVVVEKMTGSQEDLNNLGQSVAKAVVGAQKGMINKFAHDVQRSTGSNYRTY